ncbi:MAG: hypothetical protein ACM3H9_07840 [Rhodospirillaceae bacterium]
MKPLTSLLAIGLLLAGPVRAAAQTSVNSSVGGSFASYTEGATDSTRRQDVAATAGIEHLFNNQQGRVYYDLDAGTFDSPGDWAYYLNTAGFTYRFGEDDAAARKLYLNGSFVVRKNGDAWAAADYSALGGGLNGEFHPKANTTLRTGYRADYRSFADMSALTQFEQRGFASALANFQTKTTLIAEINVGAKLYDGQVMLAPVAVDVPEGTVLPAHGRGMGMGPAWRTGAAWSLPQSQDQSGAAGLVSGLVRVAQSLSDMTGVHGQIAFRQTFGAVPPALVTTPAGFFDDGVYDDPFASNAVSGQGGVTRAFTSGAEIAAVVNFADRRYTSTPALDADGSELPGAPLRHDRVWRGGVAWSQPVLGSRTGRAELSVDLGYRFLASSSNDAFYDYTSHGFALGFSIHY